MGHRVSRPSGRAGIVMRLLAGVVASLALLLATSARGDEPSPSAEPSPLWLPETDADPAVLVYPPKRGGERRPLVVMLHGMCDPPENECPFFSNTVTQFGWLACPRARLRCNGGGTMWSWQGKYETVNAAVDRVRQHGASGIDTDGDRILIGFSLGALAAMDIAHRGEGKWEKLILIGAKVYPNATLLKRAGVRRVLLASGDRDMMRWHMTEQARRLDRQGVPSTFMSLGDVGHWFAPDMDTWMTGALQWVQQEEPEGQTEPLIASAP